jgi:hypothetical protein
VDRHGSLDGRELLVNNEQGQGNTVGPQQSRPWGFWLVLAAIILVTVVYSVTMLTIGEKIQSPATAIGAMTAAFAVIGTLVGTYFGIKAGLDGQEKTKETLSRAIGEREDRLRIHTQMNGDRRNGGQSQEEQQGGTLEPTERRREEPVERQGWEGVGV